MGKRIANKGDWVMFVANNRPVYAEVLRRATTMLGCREYITTEGTISEDCVLEVRRQDSGEGDG